MTKVDSAVAKMTNAFWRRRTRLIRCQEMDNRNNITLPHPRGGGLEGGRLGMRRNRMPVRLNMFRVLSIRRETKLLKRGLHIIEISLSPTDATYILLIVTAMLMLDSKTLTSSAIQIPSSR
jgi:hypothetical protein